MYVNGKLTEVLHYLLLIISSLNVIAFFGVHADSCLSPWFARRNVCLNALMLCFGTTQKTKAYALSVTRGKY